MPSEDSIYPPFLGYLTSQIHTKGCLQCILDYLCPGIEQNEATICERLLKQALATRTLLGEWDSIAHFELPQLVHACAKTNRFQKAD